MTNTNPADMATTTLESEMHAFGLHNFPDLSDAEARRLAAILNEWAKR